jgi:hypothetical protein
MITITNTSNLVEIAWIVMGVWAAVRLLIEVKDFVEKWQENYWEEQCKKYVALCEEKEKELNALKGEEQ